MEAIQSLLTFLGLIYVVRLHPLWNPEFKRQFGFLGKLVFLVVVVLASLYPVIAGGDMLWLFIPVSAFVGFTAGVIPTMIICSTTRLVWMMARREIPVPWLWVILQLVGGVGVVSGVLQEVGTIRIQFLSQSQGMLLVILGLATLWCSTFLVWRRHFPVVL